MKVKSRSPIRRAAYWIPVAACITMMMVISTAASGYQQQMQSAAESIGRSMTKTGKKTVAVFDFTDLQGNATELGRYLAEQLSVSLSTSEATYEVIDRTHIKTLLQEHALSGTGLIDPKTARKASQLAGAECLVSGTITPFSESISLSVKLLDTNTAKILGAVTVDIPRTSTINELLARGVDQLVTSASSTTTTSKPAPTSAAPAKASPITEESNGVEVSITECKRSGRTVTCQGTLRNLTDFRLPVNFLDDGGAEIIDNLANGSKGRAVFSPRGEWKVELEPDLPVKFWVDKAEVVPEAASITVRLNMGIWPPLAPGKIRVRSHIAPEIVVLRNIPVR